MDYTATSDHIYGQSLPVKSRLARRGVVKVRMTAKAVDDIRGVVITGGFWGWYARRYLARHPLQYIYQGKTIDTDWTEYRVPVEVA